MKYTIDIGFSTLHITMEGDFSFLDSPLFQKMLQGIRKSNGKGSIRLNIRRLGSIDATGLHMLLVAHDTAKKHRRHLVFEGPNGQVEKALARAARYNALTIAA